jgi:hypothetical protein
MSQPARLPTFGNLFLSVGAMKAGTTWLFSVLSRHPALHFTPEKELHYFHHKYVDRRILSAPRRLQNAKDRYLTRFDPQKTPIDRVRRDLHWACAYLADPVDDHWYRNQFQLRPPQQTGQTWCCDFSNLHALLPVEAWPQIESQCTKLRVLYTLRDPIRRLWSHTKFHLQLTGKLTEMQDWTPAEYYRFAKQPFIFDNAEYGSVLERLHTGLRPENLMVLYYEDMHNSQRDHLRAIEEFLDISPQDYPQDLLDRRPNESRNLPMPDFFPDLFAADVARIHTQMLDLGYTPPDSWIIP